MMGSNTGTVMTLTNSIIGVSVLAMPFCFKQCGIILSVIMLFLSSLLSRLACHFLLKAAHMARRRNFEYLAFHTFGQTGKFFVGLSVIGFLMGTCIAFFVVIGDLGPVILSKSLGITNSSALRPSILLGLALFVVLPLGLLRNVNSLYTVSTATVGFYVCLVFKVIGEAMPHLLAGSWLNNVHFWRPDGIMQCIPIFSMALFCQTQLFEICDSLPNASLEHMNLLIRNAVNICTCMYICVGFFGYVAFCTQNFTGNVLMSFSPSVFSDAIKLGFVLSLGVSFPLVIFPCRASLYSLLFRKAQISHHEVIGAHIPESRFKCITIFVIGASLAVGLLIPNIELVLGLVGSTIGVIICVIFPAVAFIKVSTKPTTDRLLAQVVMLVGLLILLLGTYATLYASSETTEEVVVAKKDLVSVPPNIPISHLQGAILLQGEVIKNRVLDPNVNLKDVLDAVVNNNNAEVNKDMKEEKIGKIEEKIPVGRQEPPIPVEPEVPHPVVSVPPPDIPQNPKPVDIKVDKKEIIDHAINQDAIKKEEEELAEAEKQEKANEDKLHEELLLKLEKHKQEQKLLLQEQKQILEELKEHKKEIDREKEQGEKNKLVDEVQNINKAPVEKDLRSNDVEVNDAANNRHELKAVNNVIKGDESKEKADTLKKDSNIIPNKQVDVQNNGIPVKVEKKLSADQGVNVSNRQMVMPDLPQKQIQTNQVDSNNNNNGIHPAMIPLPLVVMNNSKLYNKVPPDSEERKANVENNDNQRKYNNQKEVLQDNNNENKIMKPSIEVPVSNEVKQVEGLAESQQVKIQRDILSENAQPVHEHDRQKRNVPFSETFENDLSNVNNINNILENKTCSVKNKDNIGNAKTNESLPIEDIHIVPLQQENEISDSQKKVMKGINDENTSDKIVEARLEEKGSKNAQVGDVARNISVLHEAVDVIGSDTLQVANLKENEAKENIGAEIKMSAQLSFPQLHQNEDVLHIGENDLSQVDAKPMSRDLKSLNNVESNGVSKKHKAKNTR